MKVLLNIRFAAILIFFIHFSSNSFGQSARIKIDRYERAASLCAEGAERGAEMAVLVNRATVKALDETEPKTKERDVRIKEINDAISSIQDKIYLERKEYLSRIEESVKGEMTQSEVRSIIFRARADWQAYQNGVMFAVWDGFNVGVHSGLNSNKTHYMRIAEEKCLQGL